MTGFFDTNHQMVAILRGITPDEVYGIVGPLLEIGYRAIEIPLNSPDPYTSIAKAVELAAPYGNCLIGAGTVLTVDQVEQVHGAGGNFIVSPNTNLSVIAKTRALNMQSFPGVFSPTEAFAAIDAGASALKFFPASILGPTGVSALRAVLPPDIPKYAVGGVDKSTMQGFWNAGVRGFGIGSNLYKSGKELNEIRRDAASLLATFSEILESSKGE